MNNDPVEVTIFVPCYNEAPRVEAAIETIVEALDGVSFEIVVSNDGSTDDTVGRVRAAQRKFPKVRITLLNSSVNRGLGYFFLAAAYVATGTYFMFIPGDNVVPVATLRQIVSRRGEADMIIPYFGEIDPRPRWRQGVSRLFTKIVNLLGGHSVRYFNGFVLHRRTYVCNSPSLTAGPAYQAEFMSHALGLGATYLEVKILITDVDKSTVLRWRNVPPVMMSLLRIASRRVQRVLSRPALSRTGQ